MIKIYLKYLYQFLLNKYYKIFHKKLIWKTECYKDYEQKKKQTEKLRLENKKLEWLKQNEIFLKGEEPGFLSKYPNFFWDMRELQKKGLI